MARILNLQRRAGVCTVTFAQAPPLRCSRAFAQRLRLAAGQQIDERLLERIRETAALDLAEQLALRLLERPRSRREIAARLLQEGLPERVVRGTLERLEAEGQHDEAESALALAQRCLSAAKPDEMDWNIVQRRCGDRLRRRGFSPASASRAVQTAWQERRAELERAGETFSSAKYQSRVP